MDSDVRRQKQQALMVQLVERKIRTRARQLYESRGCVDGFALADWVQAETEILGKSILAPLYHKTRTKNWPAAEFGDDSVNLEPSIAEQSAQESCP